MTSLLVNLPTDFPLIDQNNVRYLILCRFHQLVLHYLYVQCIYFFSYKVSLLFSLSSFYVLLLFLFFLFYIHFSFLFFIYGLFYHSSFLYLYPPLSFLYYFPFFASLRICNHKSYINYLVSQGKIWWMIIFVEFDRKILHFRYDFLKCRVAGAAGIQSSFVTVLTLILFTILARRH